MASGVTIPITIQVYKGQNLLRTEKLSQESIKIGKLSSVHLQLEDESVSRMHAVIEVSPSKEVVIVDLGSTKGTFVNGTKVTRHKLNSGDEIKVGDVRLVVTFDVNEMIEEVPLDPSLQSETDIPAVPEARPMAPPPPMGMPPRPAPPMPAPFAMAPPPIAALQQQQQVFVMPSPYGLRPVVMQVPPHIAEQVELRDGSRAVEVTALFEDAVKEVRHLDDPAGGQVTPATKGILGIGAGALGAMMLLFLVNFFQVKAEKDAIERMEKEQAAQVAAGRVSDKGERPVMRADGRGKDVAAVILLTLGVGGLFIGLSRRANEKRENQFTIGPHPGATFKAPGDDLPRELFPLVRSTGTDYELLFTSKMTGEMQLGGKSVQLNDLATSGQARPAGEFGAGVFSMIVPQDARYTLRLGENVYNVNSVAKPRAYPVPLTVDWGTQSYTGGVFAAMGLFLLLIFSVPPDPKSLSLDAFMNDQRLAKFLVKPEEQKPEEIPDWLKKNTESQNSGGKRAKEAEGKMGKKDSPAKNKIFAIKGPPNNMDLKLAKEAAKDAALKSGVLGILRSGQTSAIASIFGKDSALGRDAEDALGGLVGTEVGDAYGQGGFGLVGSGRGGGGTGEGTIGLGNLGTIGRGSGAPGGGMYGARAGNLKGRKAGAPDVIPGTAEVRGSLDKELIRRIIRRHINEVRFCYEKELTRNANLQGRVMIQFTISSTGAVVTSIVQSSTLGNPAVEQCIAQAVRRWEFPKPQGGIVIVTYPFVLKSASE